MVYSSGNYLNVAKEKEQALNENSRTQAPPSTLRKGLSSSEKMLQKIAAEEKARREAGAGGAKELVVRLGALMPTQPKVVQQQPKSEARPGTESSVVLAKLDAGDAQLRAELQKLDLQRLRQFCVEIGAPQFGSHAAHVERLVAHARNAAREHHARQRQLPQGSQLHAGAQQPPVSRPHTGTSTSSRPATNASARPTSGLSVGSLSLEEQKALLDELAEKVQAETRPGTAQSTASSFAAASAFGGNKPGAVFKRDARGLGYYRDA